MPFEEFTALPARLNVQELRQSLTSIGVEEVLFGDEVSLTMVEGDGTERIEVQPPKLQVKVPFPLNGPEEWQEKQRAEFRAKVERALASHKPQKSTKEEELEEHERQRGSRRAELKAYLVEFLGDPELLGLLKAALARK